MLSYVPYKFKEIAQYLEVLFGALTDLYSNGSGQLIKECWALSINLYAAAPFPGHCLYYVMDPHTSP